MSYPNIAKFFELTNKKMLHGFHFNTSYQKLTMMSNTFILMNQKRLIIHILPLLKLKKKPVRNQESLHK